MNGIHPLLHLILMELIKIMDVSVIFGVRTVKEQEDLYAIGRTKDLDKKPVTNLDGVNKRSKHQVQKDGFAHAVDVCPYPIDFKDSELSRARFYVMWGVIKAISKPILKESKYELRSDRDWETSTAWAKPSF